MAFPDFGNPTLSKAYSQRTGSRGSSPGQHLDVEPWEYFELAQLLKNKNVSQLFEKWNNASSRVDQLLSDKEKLMEQLHISRNEIHDLRGQLQSQQSITSAPPAPAVVAPPSVVATATDIPYYRSLSRPDGICSRVLWSLSDAQNDQDITDPKNKSRPPMQLCIRHENGDIISESDWTLLKRRLTRLVQSELRSLDPPEDPAADGVPMTKTYYQEHFNKEWNKLLNQLDDEVPLLRLCANQWKADQLVGQHLQNISDAAKKRLKGAQAAKVKANNLKRVGNPEESRAGPSKRPRTENDESAKVVGEQEQQKQLQDSHPPKSVSAGKAASKSGATPPNISISRQLGTLGSKPVDNAALAAANNTEPQEAISTPNMSAAIPPVLTLSEKHVDVSCIFVDKTVSALKEALFIEFPTIVNVENLFNAMAVSQDLASSLPSEDLRAVIDRIEAADPNSPSLEEDDTNASWGHRQFTAGNITWRTALTSWAAVGSNSVACELIGSAIKTCRVARLLCFHRRETASSFLADCYLENIIDKLWELWNDAGRPVAKGKAKESTTPSNVPVPPEGNDGPAAGHAGSSTEGLPVSEARAKKVVNALGKPELKAFIARHQITVISTRNDPLKLELVEAILKNPVCLTVAGISELESVLSSKKNTPTSKKGPKT
ncbi:hypothetical protein CPB83DRAFT_900768 [Crepidotus variabilis]|uniref:Uncharacterized protein n=1 Tax=Crepidotus variabilis TaxID=179855 RepID=A0A9P6BBF6_9AGAR|nr:hypothetical protein CPB83DRAFT_900768 [Crepidotus variabilis]